MWGAPRYSITCSKVQILTQKALVECRVVSMAESGDAKHHIVSAQVCCLPLELKHAGVCTVPRLLEHPSQQA